MNNIEIALEETMYEMIFSDIPKTNYKIRLIRFVVRLTGE